MVAAQNCLLLEHPADGEGHGDDAHGLVETGLGVDHARHVTTRYVVVVRRYLLQLFQDLLLHLGVLGHQVQQEVETVVLLEIKQWFHLFSHTEPLVLQMSAGISLILEGNQ